MSDTIAHPEPQDNGYQVILDDWTTIRPSLRDTLVLAANEASNTTRTLVVRLSGLTTHSGGADNTKDRWYTGLPNRLHLSYNPVDGTALWSPNTSASVADWGSSSLQNEKSTGGIFLRIAEG